MSFLQKNAGFSEMFRLLVTAECARWLLIPALRGRKARRVSTRRPMDSFCAPLWRMLRWAALEKEVEFLLGTA